MICYAHIRIKDLSGVVLFPDMQGWHDDYLKILIYFIQIITNDVGNTNEGVWYPTHRFCYGWKQNSLSGGFGTFPEHLLLECSLINMFLQLKKVFNCSTPSKNIHKSAQQFKIVK